MALQRSDQAIQEDADAGLCWGELYDQGQEPGQKTQANIQTYTRSLCARSLYKHVGLTSLNNSRNVTKLVVCAHTFLQIWVGCQDGGCKDRDPSQSRDQAQSTVRGKIYVVDTEKHTVEKELLAHTDSVQSLCSAEDRYVLSGSAHFDGKIAIWKVE